MEVLLAVDLLLSLVQKLQHLPDDGLQRTAQVFSAVRLSERRHMNEGRATVAQVQRRVVGEVAEIPVRKVRTESNHGGPHYIKWKTILKSFTGHILVVSV